MIEENITLSTNNSRNLMAQKTNSFERFWKELKRRKVVHVVTVYAATAFVILELVSMVAQPLKLPEWTEAFMIVLLCIGFVIAILLSWIYDITPAGINKTKPANSVSHYNKTTAPVSSGWKIATYVSGVIIIALIAFNFINKRNLNGDITKLDKTIAVLPFRNLSNDTTQLYFCDGFMEEILNNLQSVRNFTVRSRTSSDQYKDTKKSITIIGNELNANYLVEGSVGREGNNLKIWVQLIDSKADKHIWSKDYTREMGQIFSLQSEIATDIAIELKTILSSDELEKIEKIPTENLNAYNFYLQGNFYYWKGNSSHDLNIAIKLYERAVELDPYFASAYTKIATCLVNQYWYYTDRSEDALLKSKLAIDKAFEIDPDLPEAHLALGFYYYHGYLNYKQALEQSEIVLKHQPRNSEALYLSASVYRRAGNWEMAKSNFKKAFDLNPRSTQFALNTGETYDISRDYSEAQDFYPLAIMLQPDWIDPYIYLSRMYLRWEGNTKKAKEILENATRINKSFISDSLFIETNVLIDIYDGKYEEALKYLSFHQSKIFQMQFYFKPTYLYYANIYGLMNKPDLEHAYYDSACKFLENKIILMPEDPRLFSSLGIAYAGLGKKEQAIVAGEKAIELMPINKEAYRGAYRGEDLARIYVMVGEFEAALEQVEYLLSIPGPLSDKMLKLDPIWKPLWNLPDFQRITNSIVPDE